MTRFLAFPFVALFALSACGGGNGASSQAAEAPEPDDVIARVNGQPISAVALDAQIQSLSSRGQSAQPAQALNQLVDLELLAQQADESGIAQQPEIAAEIERQRAAILAQHVIRAEISDYEVSDDALRDAYRERVDGAEGTEYNAAHILLETEEDAAEMIAQLDEGADFGELAEQHSTGPTANRAGDLGWFQADQMVAPFSEAVQQLEPGSYTAEPVETQFGWHVIRLAEVREVDPPAFEDLESELRNQLVSRHIRDYLTSLRDNAEVEITDSSLDSASASGMPAAADQSPAAGE